MAGHLQASLMNGTASYDVAIAGGGLSGLALSILLARKGYSVVLAEKETYPLQRVCGEYISLESLDFLKSLGFDPFGSGATHINQLEVTNARGRGYRLQLPLGGFGISRFLLDERLASIAKEAGVNVLTGVKVSDIEFRDEGFEMQASSGNFRSRVAVACFGKRSNLDIKWKRPFVTARKNRLNNYVGVKYHVRGNFPSDMIALHVFKNGYCGIVKVEGDKYCFCYLTAAENVIRYKGDLERMEQKIFATNPVLLAALNSSAKLNPDPVTIAQVSFDNKSQVHGHVLLTGDAAGMIAPLCGNGMSMALHGSKLAFESIDGFLGGRLTRAEMEQNYSAAWRNKFSSRLKMGRLIQRLTRSPWFMSLFVTIGRVVPGMMKYLIRRTHGQKF